MRFRTLLAVIAGGVLWVSVSAPVFGAGDILFIYANRSVDGDFEPVEDQRAFGVNIFLKRDTWPISLVFGFSRSDENEFVNISIPMVGTIPGEVEGEISEFSLGVVKVWDGAEHARPFVGGGLTLLEAEFDLSGTGMLVTVSAVDDDRTVAPYVHGGVFWRLWDALEIGVEARFVTNAEVDLLGSKMDADYVQLGAIAGWGW